MKEIVDDLVATLGFCRDWLGRYREKDIRNSLECAFHAGEIKGIQWCRDQAQHGYKI